MNGTDILPLKASTYTPMENQSENKVRLLYYNLLESWNTHSASEFARLFAPHGIAIGFDGSQMIGKEQINEDLGKIFESHQVASYIGIIREIRPFSHDVFILRAVAGMIPPGQTKIKPEVNAIQCLVAHNEEGKFKIAMFQNTPAAFYGRPELSTQLTEELQQAYDNSRIDELLQMS